MSDSAFTICMIVCFGVMPLGAVAILTIWNVVEWHGPSVVAWFTRSRSCPRCRAPKRGDFCGTCGNELRRVYSSPLSPPADKPRRVMPSAPPAPPPRKVGSVVWGTH